MHWKLGKRKSNGPERKVAPYSADRYLQYRARPISFLTISKTFETRYRYRSSGRRLKQLEHEHENRWMMLFSHLQGTHEDAGERTLKEGVSPR